MLLPALSTSSCAYSVARSLPWMMLPLRDSSLVVPALLLMVPLRYRLLPTLTSTLPLSRLTKPIEIGLSARTLALSVRLPRVGIR
ncbi:hypothetical protein D3C81_1404830 [compost metagenome]